jgi:hypothetical protein
VREVVDSWSGPGIEVDAVPSPAPVETSAAAEPATPVEPTDPRAPGTPAEAPAPRAPTTPVKPPAEPRAPREPTAPRAAASNPTDTPRLTRESTPASRPTPASPTSTESASSSVNAPAAAFGAAGLPTGVRHLPKAFTRALGIASRSDKRWLTIPVGRVGEARIELALDEDGRLGDVVYADEVEAQRLAPVVRHLLGNARLLLASGRFSLDPAKVNAGVQRLRVRVEVSERIAAADPTADPEHEYEAPTAARPGHGSFTLEGGRRVTSWVYLE